MRYLATKENAHRIAVTLRAICWLMTLLAAVVTVLVILGRIEVSLTTPTGHYDHALLAEKNHNATSRFMFTQISNEKVFLTIGETVGFLTRLCLALIGLVRVFPMGFCFFRLAKFFGSIADGDVFTTGNANILLSCGAVLIAAVIATPLLNGLALPLIINNLTANRLVMSTSLNPVSLFFGAVLLVMAYVFHYGIYLQDESEHTL